MNNNSNENKKLFAPSENERNAKRTDAKNTPSVRPGSSIVRKDDSGRELTDGISTDTINVTGAVRAAANLNETSGSRFVGGDLTKSAVTKASSCNTSGSKTSGRADKSRKRKRKIIRLISISIAACIVGVVIGGLFFASYYKNYLLNKINYIETPAAEVTFVDENGAVVNIQDYTQNTVHPIIVSNEDQDEIHNYLLIGIDSRSRYYNSSGTGGLADVNMIMSVNITKGTIKMISIARDSYAYVPGYSNPMKINAAMSIGGPEALMVTDEQMLRIDIDGYAYVNFYNMARVIDAVGGVNVYVSEAEAYAEGGLNHNLEELNVLYDLPPDQDKINTTGSLWLNGRQAVAYARIRKIDSDYARSARQVEVLRGLLDRFMQLGTTAKLAAIDDILSLISTNIPADRISELAMDFLPSLSNVSIEYMQLPIDGCSNQGMYGSEWSIRPNWNAEIPFVHQFFYGETTQFDAVADIPQAPALESCSHLSSLCPNRSRENPGVCPGCIHLEDLMQ